ncbi:MAG: hypothetical protein ACI898_000747 [Flavobacteriales bacterium]|jgi:hypothetical protein
MSLAKLPKHARVWIYQADKLLSAQDIAAVSEQMQSFVAQWEAHGQELSAAFEVRDQRWLILGVDEKAQAATGCSIDGSVRLIQKIGQELNVDFFNRTLVIWENNGQMVQDHMHDFWAKRKAGIVTDETIVFNTLAASMAELNEKWKGSFSQSWHAEMW